MTGRIRPSLATGVNYLPMPTDDANAQGEESRRAQLEFQQAAAEGLCKAYAELSGTVEDLVRVDRHSDRSSNSGLRSISVDRRPMTSR